MSLIKNIGRIRQISSVFAKHGFAELMGKLGFARFIPARYRRKSPDVSLSAPRRLRQALEELGPTFIKLGQVLSSRTDLLPESYGEELSLLQDKASPLPFTVIKNAVERELGRPLSEAFKEFNSEPLASASIAQVHEATLANGRKVVVKVQRPGLDALIRTDVAILTGLAAAMERYLPETKVLAPQVLVDEFFRAMTLELDFNVEANNISKSRENLRAFPEIYVPEAFPELSTQKVLVIERITGEKLDDTAALDRLGYDKKHLAEILAKGFLKTALEDGFFHGDLHSGNIFALPPAAGGSPRIGLVDFGIMGYLTRRARESLLRIFLALHEEDFETLCYEYLDLGRNQNAVDQESFQRALQAAIAPYLGLPLQKVNVGKLLLDATAIAARHRIRVPRDWIVVFKAIYTLEGTCRKLDPKFNAVPFLETFLSPLLHKKISWTDLSRELAVGSRDAQFLVQTLPRQIQWFFKRIAANNYALEVKNATAEEDRRAGRANAKLIATAIITGACLLTAGGLFFTAVAHQHALAKALAILLFLYAALNLWRFPNSD